MLILTAIIGLIHLFIYVGCPEGEIRLLGGTTALEGRVEVCTNNEWNRVCEVGWGNADAKVVCRQLGYSETGESEHH